jgi:hypothetical protein
MSYIDTKKIRIDDNNKVSYGEIHDKNNKLTLITPPMRILFDIKEEYGKYKLKLELSNLEKDENMQHFLKKVIEIEQIFINYFNIEDELFKSPLKQYNNYDPFIEIKLPYRYKKFEFSINSKVKSLYLPTSSHLTQNTIVECKLEIPSVWKYTDITSTTSYGYQLNLKEINIVKSCV